MKTILKIFKDDLLGIKKSILTIILAVGLCALPALYAWFNIYANWDPYANTGNINIAVVNLDDGYTQDDGTTVNMGQSVIDKLKEQTSIGWIFPDTEDKALDGVKSGEYYAAVVISADFSSNMYNALTDNFVKPSFTYYENEKKNAVAPKITDTAVSTLKTSINETYIKTISQKLLADIDDSDSDLKNALTGSDFIKTLKTVDDNLAAYQKLISSIISANNTLNKNTDLKSATKKAKDLITSADSDINKTISEMGTAGSAYYTLRDNLQSQIEDIAGDIKAIQNSERLARLKEDTADAAADLKAIYNDADALTKKLDTLQTYLKSLDIANEPAVKDAIEKIDNLKEQISSIADQTSDSINSVDITDLNMSQKELTAKLADVNQALSRADSSITNDIIPAIDNVMLNIKNALTSMSNLLNTVGNTLTGVNGVFETYQSTLTSMDVTLTDLSDLITDVRSKIADGIDQINKAADSEVMDMIMAFLNGDSEALASFLSKPVMVQENYFYQISNYGSSMSPFYSILAIWVGMTILVSLMKVHVSNDEFRDAKPYQLFFGRYLIFFLLSQLQVLIIVLGDLYILKIQCLHPFLFWFSGAMAGLTFSILIYSLTISFGDIGKALAVVIMVLQIAGSGGTYPIEALPSFFRQVYIFFPFPYAINAMRECIGGLYHYDLLRYLAELSIFIGAALLIGLVIRKPFIHIMHFIEKRMEDTEMM